jgi:two-component system nitrogen regulation response regulator NtrX
VAEFRKHPDAHRADAYLLDMKLPDGSGIDLLKAVRQNGAAAPAVMISGHGTIADAVEATRAGAFDFLEKPLSRDRVLLAVKNALEQSTLRQERNERLRELVGGTQDDREQPGLAAGGGTGDHGGAERCARAGLIGAIRHRKELLAAHIHTASPFAAGPFVGVNCAAIPNEPIETELLRHEKGSFTGATALRGAASSN